MQEKGRGLLLTWAGSGGCSGGAGGGGVGSRIRERVGVSVSPHKGAGPLRARVITPSVAAPPLPETSARKSPLEDKGSYI